MCVENPVVEAKDKDVKALKDVVRSTFWSRFPTDPNLEYPELNKNPVITVGVKKGIGSSGDYR